MFRPQFFIPCDPIQPGIARTHEKKHKKKNKIKVHNILPVGLTGGDSGSQAHDSHHYWGSHCRQHIVIHNQGS